MGKFAEFGVATVVVLGLFVINVTNGAEHPKDLALPPGVELLNPKDLGLSEGDLEKFLGKVKQLSSSNGGSGGRTQILTVGFGENEKLNLQDFEQLSSDGLEGRDKAAAQNAFNDFKQHYSSNSNRIQDTSGTEITPVTVSSTAQPLQQGQSPLTISQHHQQAIDAVKQQQHQQIFQVAQQQQQQQQDFQAAQLQQDQQQFQVAQQQDQQQSQVAQQQDQQQFQISQQQQQQQQFLNEQQLHEQQLHEQNMLQQQIQAQADEQRALIEQQLQIQLQAQQQQQPQLNPEQQQQLEQQLQIQQQQQLEQQLQMQQQHQLQQQILSDVQQQGPIQFNGQQQQQQQNPINPGQPIVAPEQHVQFVKQHETLINGGGVPAQFPMQEQIYVQQQPQQQIYVQQQPQQQVFFQPQPQHQQEPMALGEYQHYQPQPAYVPQQQQLQPQVFPPPQQHQISESPTQYLVQEAVGVPMYPNYPPVPAQHMEVIPAQDFKYITALPPNEPYAPVIQNNEYITYHNVIPESQNEKIKLHPKHKSENQYFGKYEPVTFRQPSFSSQNSIVDYAPVPSIERPYKGRYNSAEYRNSIGNSYKDDYQYRPFPTTTERPRINKYQQQYERDVFFPTPRPTGNPYFEVTPSTPLIRISNPENAMTSGRSLRYDNGFPKALKDSAAAGGSHYTTRAEHYRPNHYNRNEADINDVRKTMGHVTSSRRLGTADELMINDMMRTIFSRGF